MPKNEVQAIIEAGKRLYMRNLVAANDGNISLRLTANQLLITATNRSKGFLQPADIVQMDLDGRVLQGGQPSSEAPLHLALLRRNPLLQAVVHAHPLYATSFATAGLGLPAELLPEIVLQLGDVPLVPYATTGSAELAATVAEYALDYHAVLLANHGAVCWGTSLEQALGRMEALEHYAQILFNVRYVLKQENALTAAQLTELRQVAVKFR